MCSVLTAVCQCLHRKVGRLPRFPSFWWPSLVRIVSWVAACPHLAEIKDGRRALGSLWVLQRC